MSVAPNFQTLLNEINRASVQLKTKEHLLNITNFQILSIALLLDEMVEFNLMPNNLQVEEKLSLLYNYFPFCFEICTQKEITKHYGFIVNYSLKKGLK
ncbi:MAG: hypothetical protein KAJ30_08545, partial [Candidatus Heimdallarchaeota archaeon]|nr:hypothetical protein [Candidatus Heimdallarchaeota archaeon]